MKRFTLCLTGGHLAPAIAIAQVCRNQYPAISLLFIGREYSFEKERGKSVEEKAMRPLVDAVYTIQTGRITVRGVWNIFRSILRSYMILKSKRPDVILSFGGYVAIPVVFAGWLLRIPIVTHEQTRVIGRANRCIGFFAKKVCVSFPDMVNYQTGDKGVYTGLPLRPDILEKNEKPLILLPHVLPCIYITGGTTGAVSLNEMIFSILPKLLDQFVVIHQTGNLSYVTAEKIASHLPNNLKQRYFPKSYFSSSETSWIFHHIRFVVSRSGANTVWEVGALGIPAILVPLPWSHSGEQQKNAQWLGKKGAALILDQNNTTSESLLLAILTMYKEYGTYKRNAEAFSQDVPRDGAERLLQVVISQIS
jgi:UDP-N-acetylglucosamine--N-acetylmuramyl-(pentapeptide) pyrophosphoryl-undecaprenol N-acetylglucosamine transferase